MSAVTGPPPELDERRDELTPMLQQYVDRCREHDDALVLFRVGDFYKTFCGIAEEVARICELTMIEREDSTGTYDAAGIPVDNAAEYIERLLEAGHRIAIADQVEDPSETNGIVERAVTQIITPGTVVDDELLSPDSTYVASVVGGEEAFAVASVDVSTGECRVAP
ncbi:MutS N-terminal domain-containing protein, partial [Halolamina salina]